MSCAEGRLGKLVATDRSSRSVNEGPIKVVSNSWKVRSRRAAAAKASAWGCSAIKGCNAARFIAV